LVRGLSIFVFETHELFKLALLFEEFWHLQIGVFVWELRLERILEAKDVVVFIVEQVDLSVIVLAEVSLKKLLLCVVKSSAWTIYWKTCVVDSSINSVGQDSPNCMLEWWVLEWLEYLLLGHLLLFSWIIDTSLEELKFLEALERSLV
jgi:hypothetical protein